MKITNNAFLILTLFALNLFGCTRYEVDSQDYESLTPQNISTDLKVVNIVVNQADFNRMYSNYDQEIEINALLNLYKGGQILIDSERVELEVKGNTSTIFELKSIGVKFHEKYDNTDRKLIDPEVFSFHSLDYIKAFRLRNSGNDFIHTMLKDMSYTQLAINANLNLDLTYAEQVVLFVNDEFMGVMNLRTEANTNGMAGLYNAAKRDVTLAKVIWSRAVEKKDGDFNRIDRFLSAIDNGDFDYLKNEIDIDNFIDYIIFESFAGNEDWPYNNVRFYSIKGAPFRFVLFDLDNVAIGDLERNPLDHIQNVPSNHITDLFNLMYADQEFKLAFDERLRWLINSDLFSSESFDQIVNEYRNNIEHIIPSHFDKYSVSRDRIFDWFIEVNLLKSRYKERGEYLKELMK